MLAVGFGRVIPTVGFGEPWRWPGELVGPDVEGLGFAVALRLAVGLGLGVGVGVAATGAGEMGELAESAAWVAEDAAADAWATADAAAELTAAELTAAELSGVRSAGVVDVLQAASAEKTATTTTIWARRAVRVRRGIPHAATPGRACPTSSVTAHA